VADRFPSAETGAFDKVDAVGSGAPASRIEAGRRPDRAAQPAQGVTIVYREDDGPLDRARALASLAARHPGRVLTASRVPRVKVVQLDPQHSGLNLVHARVEAELSA